MSLTGTFNREELATVSVLCDNRLNELQSKKKLTEGEAEESRLLFELSSKLATNAPLKGEKSVVILNVSAVSTEAESTMKTKSKESSRTNVEFYQDMLKSIELSKNTTMLEVFYYTLAMIELMEDKPLFEINTYMSEYDLSILISPYADSMSEIVGNDLEIEFEVRKQGVYATISSPKYTISLEYDTPNYFRYVQKELYNDIRSILS